MTQRTLRSIYDQLVLASPWRIIRPLLLQQIFNFRLGNFLLKFCLNVLCVELLIDNEIFFFGVVTIFLTLIRSKEIKGVFTSWNHRVFLIILAVLINLGIILRLTPRWTLFHLRLQVQWHVAAIVAAGKSAQPWVLHLLFIIVKLHKSIVLAIDISNGSLRMQQSLTLRVMQHSTISIHIVHKQRLFELRVKLLFVKAVFEVPISHFGTGLLKLIYDAFRIHVLVIVNLFHIAIIKLSHSHLLWFLVDYSVARFSDLHKMMVFLLLGNYCLPFFFCWVVFA